VPELPHDKRERLSRQTSINRQQAQLLSDEPKLADFFEQTVSELQQLDKEQTDIAAEEIKALVQRAANVILRDVRKLAAETLAITPANFAELVVLLHHGKLNPGAVPDVLAEMQKTGGDPDHILRNLGLEQVSEVAELERIIDEVIAENQDVVAKVKGGKETALQALVGQVMQKTRGKANPQVVIELLKQKITG
jgi:aspartyl-tRNA(Asn)/glutamyl-tRNA(Gln) amidotransferase subunit B